MSYRTESSDEDFDAKLEELENIYKNVLNQQGEMKYEIQNITENKNKVPAYSEISSEYTYRYDYNEEYDLTVTKSSLGLADEYQLVKKADSNIKIRVAKVKKKKSQVIIWWPKTAGCFITGDNKKCRHFIM